MESNEFLLHRTICNNSYKGHLVILYSLYSIKKVILYSLVANQWTVQYADRSECNDKVSVQNTGLAPWRYKESGKSAETSQLKYLIQFV